MTYLAILSSSSGYIASNGTMISERWIGKDKEGSGRSLVRDTNLTLRAGSERKY
jgi:hypothetical protein